MPKEYFSLANVTSIESIPKNGRIHVIGICGVAMAQVSILLSKQGYQVTGSDKEFYEPMGSLLKSSKIKTFLGYKGSHVPLDADLVVIGNAISYGNDEVSIVEEHKLPYTLFPKLLGDVVIGDRHSIVVAGTHGKSTTTSLIAYTLTGLNVDPSYFVGGHIKDLDESLHIGAGAFAAVEGDEYDSAFFAKTPKFNFYKASTLIITSLEYDHADIYPNLEAIEVEFTRLVNSRTENDRIIVCTDDENLKRLLPEWRRTSKATFFTYGTKDSVDVQLLERTIDTTGLQEIKIRDEKDKEKFSLLIPGQHNALNAIAAWKALTLLRQDKEGMKKAFRLFQGIKRRQDIIYNDNGIVVIEDFAHHPTAVKETVQAIRSQYPQSKLWAVFEPRSATSRRKVFYDQYMRAFDQADKVIICEVAARELDTGIELLDVKDIVKDLLKLGKDAIALPSPQAIEDYVVSNARHGDIILLMSNGAFGGISQTLPQRLVPFKKH